MAKGVNWESVAVIVSSAVTVASILYGIGSRRFERWSVTLGKRLDALDEADKANTAAQVITASAVARIEGYMAGSSGEPYKPSDRT